MYLNTVQRGKRESENQKVIVKGRPEFAMWEGEGEYSKKEYPVWVMQALRKFEDILWK